MALGWLADALVDCQTLYLAGKRFEAGRWPIGWLAVALIGREMARRLAGSRSNYPKMAIYPPLRKKSNFPLKMSSPFRNYDKLRYIVSSSCLERSYKTSCQVSRVGTICKGVGSSITTIRQKGRVKVNRRRAPRALRSSEEEIKKDDK
jgi:hypothetical protein